MPRYPVTKLGAVGLISPRDMRPHETPPNAWSSVSNARMLNGSVLSVNHWTALTDLGASNCHALDYYNAPAGGSTHLYAYMDDKILSVDNNGVTATVSKVGLISSPYPSQIWITDQLNGIPIATNNRDAPQCFYNPGGTVDATTLSQDFPAWQTGVTARLVLAYKNFIVAMNIVDTDAFPNMVWWSDAAEPGLMPGSWDYADTTNLAGRTTLGADSGAILGAAVLRDSLFIYTEYSTYRMDFVGGGFVMRFAPVFQNSGIFGPRCVAKYGERHFVITKSDIVMHDGQQMTSVADEKVRNRFLDGATDEDTNRVWCQVYRGFSEIWTGFPETQDKTFNALAVWTSEDGVWSVRDAPDSRYMRELPILEASATDDSWDNGAAVSWDDGPDNIWNEGGTIGDLQPVCTSTDNFLYIMDSGDQVTDTVLVREDIGLGPDAARYFLYEFYPKITGQQAVQIRFGGSSTVGGVTQWGDYVTYTPNVDNKIKTRVLERRHALEVKGKGFEFEAYDMIFKPVGNR